MSKLIPFGGRFQEQDMLNVLFFKPNHSTPDVSFFKPYQSISDVFYRSATIITAPIMYAGAAAFTLPLMSLSFCIPLMGELICLLEQSASTRATTNENWNTSTHNFYFGVVLACCAVLSPFVNLTDFIGGGIASVWPQAEPSADSVAEVCSI